MESKIKEQRFLFSSELTILMRENVGRSKIIMEMTSPVFSFLPLNQAKQQVLYLSQAGMGVEPTVFWSGLSLHELKRGSQGCPFRRAMGGAVTMTDVFTKSTKKLLSVSRWILVTAVAPFKNEEVSLILSQLPFLYFFLVDPLLYIILRTYQLVFSKLLTY